MKQNIIRVKKWLAVFYCILYVRFSGLESNLQDITHRRKKKFQNKPMKFCMRQYHLSSRNLLLSDNFKRNKLTQILQMGDWDLVANICNHRQGAGLEASPHLGLQEGLGSGGRCGGVRVEEKAGSSPQPWGLRHWLFLRQGQGAAPGSGRALCCWGVSSPLPLRFVGGKNLSLTSVDSFSHWSQTAALLVEEKRRAFFV